MLNRIALSSVEWQYPLLLKPWSNVGNGDSSQQSSVVIEMFLISSSVNHFGDFEDKTIGSVF